MRSLSVLPDRLSCLSAFLGLFMPEKIEWEHICLYYLINGMCALAFYLFLFHLIPWGFTPPCGHFKHHWHPSTKGGYLWPGALRGEIFLGQRLQQQKWVLPCWLSCAALIIQEMPSLFCCVQPGKLRSQPPGTKRSRGWGENISVELWSTKCVQRNLDLKTPKYCLSKSSRGGGQMIQGQRKMTVYSRSWSP
jgi:hypothetical protein